MVVARLRLEVARRRGVPDFPSTTHARCVPLVAALVVARCESDLSTERCLVAMSTLRREGLSGREPHSKFIMVRQRGAIE